MWHDLKIFHKGLILVGMLIAVELGFAFTLAKLLQDAAVTVARESFYSNISGRTSQIFELAFEIHGNLLCYVWTGSSLYGKRVRAALWQTEQEYNTLERLVQGNPLYLSRLKHCRELTSNSTPMIEEVVRLAEERKLPDAFELFTSADFVEKKKPVLAALYSFIEEQQPMLNENVLAAMQANASVKKWIVIGAVINVLLAIALFLLLVRGITRRLGVVVENANRLASSSPLHPVLRGKDEVGDLDRVFHQMASVLEEARKREQAIIENACDVICSIDSSGKFLKVSSASEPVWGARPEMLVNLSLGDLVVKGDLASSLHAIEKMKTGNGDQSFENRIKHQGSGAILNMLWSAHWSDRDQCVFCVVHDITEHKQVEELLKTSEGRIRTILNNTLVGLLSLREDGCIEQLNPRAEELLQFDSSELTGKHLWSLFESRDSRDGAQFLQELRRESMELNAVRKDGQVLPVELSLGEFGVADTKRLLVNIVDVTERRQLEQMKQEFVSTVSDNLRIPLDCVRQFLQQVSENPSYASNLKERGVQGASLAMRNVARLLRLTNDLVDVATFESGGLELERGDCQLSGILERSVEAVRVFSEKHSVALDVESCNCRIFADQDRLERVIVNLLSNAIKFSPPGSQVSILVEEGADRATVKVVDQGRGIPASHINLVFERFKQVNATDASQKGGTGLGLAICKAIIEQHGGNIGVNSEVGKGSTFWFWIPKDPQAVTVCV